jgi:Domain of unknown function (DUF1905)
MTPVHFTATILEGHKDPAVEVPFDPSETWGVPASQIRKGRNGHRVRGTLNGADFESSIVPRMKHFWLEIPDEIRQRAGVAVGELVSVSLMPFTAKK